jgi:hypothetical protein
MASVFAKIKKPYNFLYGLLKPDYSNSAVKLKSVYGQIHKPTDMTSPIYIQIIHILQRMYNQFF